jgi:hypothetical protein
MPTGERDIEEVQEGLQERFSGQEVEPELEEEVSTDGEEYDPKESAKDSLERFLGDAAPKGEEPLDLSGGKGEKEPENELELDPEKPLKTKGKKPDDLEIDPELLAPARLDEAGQKMFANLPKGLKRAYHKALRDVERGGSQATQQAQAVLKEWQPLREAIHPFAQKWAEMGVGVVPGILQLAAAQARLTDANIEVREAEYLKMAARSKVDIVKLARKITGQQGVESGEIPDVSNHPVISELVAKNNQLSKYYESLQSKLDEQQIERQAAPLLAEMEAVRNEKDPASGRLKYPALHDEVFLDSVKTLVSELVRDNPNLSYPDALRKGHDIRMKQMLGESFQAGVTRFPVSNGNNTHRALSAGMSVRGRTSPAMSAIEPEIPTDIGRDTKKSLEWFLRGNSR